MAPDDELTPSILSFRLSAVEHSVAKLETRMAESFAILSTQLNSLSFVRSDVYAIEQHRAAEQLEALKESMKTTHTLAMWAVGLVCGTTIGAIVLAILTFSGTFR